MSIYLKVVRSVCSYVYGYNTFGMREGKIKRVCPLRLPRNAPYKYFLRSGRRRSCFKVAICVSLCAYFFVAFYLCI
ncbi:hypothetical protein EI94DRAFT_73439 [Lactarius quietus]|nr:hypothetical protein EI94DRAFT_73439 [Lactarius quietus]